MARVQDCYHARLHREVLAVGDFRDFMERCCDFGSRQEKELLCLRGLMVKDVADGPRRIWCQQKDT